MITDGCGMGSDIKGMRSNAEEKISRNGFCFYW